MERDLTVGSVPKKLIRFAIPLFLSTLLQSCYSVVDMVVMGRFVGSAGLAAVSNASRILFLITSIGSGITIGGTVLIAQYKGAQDRQGQKETAGTMFSVSAIVSLAITLICILMYKQAFAFMQVPFDALRYTYNYFLITSLGTIFVFGYNSVCAIMRGLGDSKSPLVYVTIATVVNIVLDVLLVGPLGMGTSGAALATVASQAVSFAIAVAHLRRSGFIFDFALKSFCIKPDTCRIILKVGFPSTIQMVILNVSYLLVTGMLNVYGVAVAAASSVGLRVNTIAVMPAWAVGQAVTTMAGQNMGAGNVTRTEATVKYGVLLAMAVTLCTVVPVQLFVRPLIALFDTDPEIIRQGIVYLRICCSVNCLVYAAMFTIDSFATGVGDSLFSMRNSMLHSVVMRLALSVLLGITLGRGFIGIYWGEMISPVLPCIAGIIYFACGKWKTRRLIQK